MSLVSRVSHLFRRRSGTDGALNREQIIAQLDPWVLACAVGAMNGSIYGNIGSRGHLNFDLWFYLLNKDRLERIGPLGDLRESLRWFAFQNRNFHMFEVMREECRKRGLPEPEV